MKKIIKKIAEKIFEKNIWRVYQSTKF